MAKQRNEISLVPQLLRGADISSLHCLPSDFLYVIEGKCYLIYTTSSLIFSYRYHNLLNYLKFTLFEIL